VAVRGPVPLEDLVAGVIACLPVECRTAVSFSTGLVQCSPRPPRIVAMPPSGVMPRRLTAAANVVTLDLTTEEPRSSRLVDHWARLIERTLDTGQFCFLAEELSRARPDIAADDLSALGLQLLEDLEASRLHERGDEPLRAHAAHRRFEKTAQAATAPPRTGPSQFLHADSPEVVTKLEVLDDVVFDAVGGCAQSLQRLNSIWPALRAELGDDLLAESREQYLRYAVSIWERCIAEDVIRDPVRAVQVLDVLCVLLDET
jgi:hypothetical protein